MPVSADLIARVEKRVKIDPGFGDALTAFVDAPPSGVGSYTRTAAEEINSTRRRNAIDEFRAGSFATSQVQKLLGLGTPQAVHRLRSRGKLIGLQSGNATWFPSWQFWGGQVREDLPRVLAVLRGFTNDPIACDRAMRIVRGDLGGRSISEAIDDPRWAGAAWETLAELAA